MSSQGLEILIPAAGASSRLGHPKQLVEVDGQTLIRRVVALAESVQPAAIHVVLGAQRERIERALAGCQSIRIHHNPDYFSGIAGSLQTGLAQVRPACCAVLVLLPDQVYVSASDLQRLVSAWQTAPDRPAAAAYAGTFGVPAILPRALFGQVMALSGDRGARAILGACRDQLITVPMPGAAFDLDTPLDECLMRGMRDRP